MHVAGDVEPERETEDPPLAQASLGLLRRVAVQQREVLFENLPERPVRNAFAVGKAASDPAKRHLLLALESFPELAHEPRLPEPGITEDRHQHRV